MLQQTLRDLEGESWKEQIYLGQQNCTEFPLYGFCVYAAHSSVQVRGAVTAGVALRPTHELLLCCLHADCLLHCMHSTDVLISVQCMPENSKYCVSSIIVQAVKLWSWQSFPRPCLWLVIVWRISVLPVVGLEVVGLLSSVWAPVFYKTGPAINLNHACWCIWKCWLSSKGSFPPWF